MGNQHEIANAQTTTFSGAKKHFPVHAVDTQATPAFDRLLHASVAKFSGFSPVSLVAAYLDWGLHLAAAPGKQLELVQSAFEKAFLLSNYIFQQAMQCSESTGCLITPMPQDRRFQDVSWQRWPYNFYQQAFLMTEQWWQDATSSIRGVSQHHREMVPFLARQWLDMWSPLNFPLTNPKIIDATLAQGGINLINGWRNFIDDVTRLINKAPPVGAEAFQVGENIAITKGKVIYQNRLMELIQYEPTTAKVYAEPILIVPAWIMKYYILDLSPHNSLVKYLVEQGYTVFMISWKNPDASDRDISFEDYVTLGVMRALKAVSTIIPDQKIQAIGYCIGGTALSIAASAMARDNDERLASITLLAAQVDFEDAGELLLFIDESQLAFLEDVMWEQGYLDANRMAGTFYMLRSQDLIWSRVVESYFLGYRAPVIDLMAWNADTTRLPYRAHSEYLRSLFLNNDLSEGNFKIKRKSVSLADIRVPIFAVSTERDHVSPWRSVYKIHLFANTEITFVLTTGGHNAGILSEPGHPNRSYRMSTAKSLDKYIEPEQWLQDTNLVLGSWWPAWVAWLTQHTSGKVAAPAMMGQAKQGYKILSDAPGEYVYIK